jgi:NTE family protein
MKVGVALGGGGVRGLAHVLALEMMDECDVTIAIDVAATREVGETKPPNLIDATLGMFDILVDRVTESMMKERPPTIYFRPKLVGIRILDFEKIKSVFEQTQPAMEELKTKLDRIQSCFVNPEDLL